MNQKELENIVLKNQKLYYNGTPEISDEEFDNYWNELKEQYPSSKLLKKIGTDTIKGFEKKEHFHIMGSQNKCANMKEFEDWYNRKEREKLMVQLKLDGASIALYYLNGKFCYAITRGDGKIGDDITENVVKMKGLPLQINNDFSGQIRGEVLIFKDDFEKYFVGEKNCRNSAVGTMKRKNGEKCEYLSIVVYDAYSCCDFEFKNEVHKIETLRNWRFNIVPYRIYCDIESIARYRLEITRLRENLKFDIDGLVVKDNEIDYGDLERDRPLNSQVAIKFELDQAETILREVEFSENFGQYTPVAIFDPVQLNGTQVSRASLANTNIIKELNLKIGSKIVVSKCGEIIPKVIKVLEVGNDEIIIPNKCSYCGSTLIDNGQSIFCCNNNCDSTKLHRLQKWISEMEIQFIGDETLKKLYYKCNIKEIHNLFSLKEEDISKIDGMGKAIAKKIIKEIHNDKNFKLDKIIAGVFDNRLIGAKRVRYLINAGYNTWHKLRNISVEEIKKVNGWSDTLAEAWSKAMYYNCHELDLLLV